MIIRVWRAKVHKGMEVDFWSFIQAQAVPLMHRQPGLIALHVGSILWGGGEFVIVSTWQDLNALQTFAGERWRDPFILPGEERFLVRAWVDHYHDQVVSDHRSP